MTDLHYQIESYLREVDAVITDTVAEPQALVLDKTIFYPGGGGQPPDQGVLRVGDTTYTVTRARRVGDQVLHLIDGENPLPTPGTPVHAVLDWTRRYNLMRTHTALHILCGVVFRDYGALVTGGDMNPLAGRMDFEFETMHKELVQEIEAAINQEVAKAHPVNIDILPRETAFQIPDLIRTKINLLPEGIEQVRVVEIEGLDLQADGGTHVRNTAEVGPIRVADYKSKGKINKRIYIELSEKEVSD